MRIILLIALAARFTVEPTAAETEPNGVQMMTEGKAILQTKLGQYDGSIRPEGANHTGPVEVMVNLFVRNIENINVDKREWKIQMTFRMQWLDDRLSYKLPYKNLRFISVVSQDQIDQIWKPDVFFANEKEFKYHDGLRRNQYMRVFPNGEVLYSTRITTTLSCGVFLVNFPHDAPVCNLRLASYAYTANDTLFKWKEVDPVQVTTDLHIPDFSITSFRTDYCDSQTNTGVYSCLRADFNFLRAPSASWNYGYFPMIVSVFLGWLSFWLGPNSPSRIAIVLTSFFYFKQVEIEFRGKYSPSVSYGTIFDKWTSTCFYFVLVSLIQFVVVSYLSSRSEIEATRKPSQDTDIQEVNDPLMEGNGTKAKFSKRLTSASERLQKGGYNWIIAIDVVFRVAYPIGFVIFLFVYYGNISRIFASYEKGNYFP